MNDGDENKIPPERKKGNFAKFENKLKGTIKCAAGYSFGTKLKTAFKLCFKYIPKRTLSNITFQYLQF